MRRARVSRLLAGAFVLLTAGNADAQLAGGYRQDLAAEPTGRFLSASDQARATLNAYAQCLMKTRPVDAAKAVALPPGDASEKVLRNMAVDSCLSFGQLEFSPDLLRGALFVQMYREKFGAHAPSIGGPIDFGAEIPSDDRRHDALTVLRDFADCTVRADQIDARESVLVPIGSHAESAAYTGLAPHFNACLQKGQQVKFTMAVLSGLIAEVLYRDAVAANAAAPLATGN